jgi:dienelactone hydrolase
MQSYPAFQAEDVRVLAHQVEDNIDQQLLIMSTPFGYRRVAELTRPTQGDVLAAILFVHWYEPESPSSHRSQFDDEAKELAKLGAVCLTIETLWSDRDFFLKRTQADDATNSIQEVINLRRSLDFLLAQPDIDPKRVAYVGHDFGGMYGVLMGALDRRPSQYVIMAATPRFPDWYLYLPKLEGDARAAFIEEMKEIDPITHVANLAPASVLMQFAKTDRHVPLDRAEEFFAAANEPKEVKWYEAGHSLNDEATIERKAWLIEQLGLR